MLEWILFVVFITSPGVFEVTASFFDSKVECQQALERTFSLPGTYMVCERRPKA